MTTNDAAITLKECRDRIDLLDGQILALLNERASVATEIGKTKAAAGMPVIELSRERSVIEGMVKRNSGPLEPGAVERIYAAVMLEMRRLQQS